MFSGWGFPVCSIGSHHLSVALWGKSHSAVLRLAGNCIWDICDPFGSHPSAVVHRVGGRMQK